MGMVSRRWEWVKSMGVVVLYLSVDDVDWLIIG